MLILIGSPAFSDDCLAKKNGKVKSKRKKLFNEDAVLYMRIEGPIKQIIDRYFIGYCRSPIQFDKIFKIYNDKREKILEIYRNFRFLRKRYKKRAVKYIIKFYEIINSPKRVKRHILNKCIKG